MIDAIYQEDRHAGEEHERNGKRLLIRKSPELFGSSISAQRIQKESEQTVEK